MIKLRVTLSLILKIKGNGTNWESNIAIAILVRRYKVIYVYNIHLIWILAEDVDESSLDSTLKSSTSDVSIQIENVAEESDETDTISEEDIKFYVPDTTLPMRFRPIEAYDNYVEKEYPKPLLYTSYDDDDNFNIEEQDIFAEDYLAEEIVAEVESNYISKYA